MVVHSQFVRLTLTCLVGHVLLLLLGLYVTLPLVSVVTAFAYHQLVGVVDARCQRESWGLEPMPIA